MNKKMADIDIDPLRNMNRGLKNQLMNIFLSFQGEEEYKFGLLDQAGAQSMNKKHHLQIMKGRKNL